MCERDREESENLVVIAYLKVATRAVPKKIKMLLKIWNSNF